ncbi:hypothetical protein GCM10009801_67750 [Streptomyces albiaxialis]|uniref:YCII-related domain-containing protein n=1 Tax=Streptomyces albiaxialis TaxID=329523 RepID=A0ABP5IBA5_9ACTN
MRHLTPAFALGALRRGRQVEQFLGVIEGDADRYGCQGLRWIALSPGRTGIAVTVCDVEDVGSGAFLDITEFPPLDPDEDEPWGRRFALVDTPEEALRVAERDLAADPGRWVNQGVVCDEYRDFRAAFSA